MTANGSPERRACAVTIRIRSDSKMRFGRPVSASCVAMWRSFSSVSRWADMSRPMTSTSAMSSGVVRRDNRNSNQVWRSPH